jgi:hypothetical protein
MIASVGVAVTFPLAFVAGRTHLLPWIALGALALQVPLAWAAAEAFELDGLALALTFTTLIVLGALLRELDALRPVARGLAIAAAAVGGLTLLAFVPPTLVLGAAAAAAVGLLAYVVILALLRPRPLTLSWRYLRSLR